VRVLAVLLFVAVSSASAETFRRLPETMAPELAALSGAWVFRMPRQRVAVRFEGVDVLRDGTPVLVGRSRRSRRAEVLAFRLPQEIVVLVSYALHCERYRLRWHSRRRLRGEMQLWQAGCVDPWRPETTPVRARRARRG